MCVACRKRRPKYELLRFVERNGVLYFDPLWRAEGRGVNICPDKRCIELAVKRGLLRRALNKEVSIPKLEDLMQSIEETFERVIIDTLRLARRFGGVVLGRTAVDRAIDRVNLIILAVDLDEDVVRYFVEKGKPYRILFTKEKWGEVFSRRPVGVIGVKDRGVTEKLIKIIDRFLKVMEVV